MWPAYTPRNLVIHYGIVFNEDGHGYLMYEKRPELNKYLNKHLKIYITVQYFLVDIPV